mmetsp:Transcript_35999/g.32379  ORF Transcript_35999/g.32379 Transcript_35999/m.32379 type:complete len:89 (+) Transcript_35999:68-334(+)
MKSPKKEKILSRASKSLTYLDIFGIPNRLYLKGEEDYRTRFGGLLTLAAAAIVIILSIQEIEAVTKNEKKIFNIGTSRLEETGTLELN